MEYCEHVEGMVEVTLSADGCEDYLKMGGRWTHLRPCPICGHVGCRDNSPNRHSTKHCDTTKHPIVKSFEPREDWGYCYPDDQFFEPLP
ncbi:MAG: UBP-type zinc finger domain-containing protein [bacterium]|nr:UBP-type zinc finger domain-containing protein [bacterium]